MAKHYVLYHTLYSQVEKNEEPSAKNSARTVGAKGRVFPEALTQSALAGGGGATYFAGKIHGTFVKHRNLQHFGANSLPQFLVLQLCGKDCDKQNGEFRCSLAIWPDLAPS